MKNITTMFFFFLFIQSFSQSKDSLSYSQNENCGLEYKLDVSKLQTEKKIEFNVTNRARKNLKVAKNFDNFMTLQAVNIEKLNSAKNEFEKVNIGYWTIDCFTCTTKYEKLKPDQTKKYVINSDSIRQFKDFEKNQIYRFNLFFEIYTITNKNCKGKEFISQKIIYKNE